MGPSALQRRRRGWQSHGFERRQGTDLGVGRERTNIALRSTPGSTRPSRAGPATRLSRAPRGVVSLSRESRTGTLVVGRPNRLEEQSERHADEHTDTDAHWPEGTRENAARDDTADAARHCPPPRGCPTTRRGRVRQWTHDPPRPLQERRLMGARFDLPPQHPCRYCSDCGPRLEQRPRA